jgi:hypothetical protein
MPDFLWTARGDIPPAGDAAFEALLAGKLAPEDAADGLRPLADAIAALTMPPVPSEIVAEPGAREAYRDGFARPAGTVILPRHRRPALASLIPVRLAAASLVLLGLLAAAAYSGLLPAPAQRFAHDAFGAPAPRVATHSVPPASPPGPPGTSGKIPPGQVKKTPPGHGGTPPGQAGKTPPGQAGKTPPGQAGKTPPGQAGKTPPGQAGKTPPGHSAGHHKTPPPGPG